MASDRTVLRVMGQAMWDPTPTKTDLRARQLAVALGYPVDWRVVRTIEEPPPPKAEVKAETSASEETAGKNTISTEVSPNAEGKPETTSSVMTEGENIVSSKPEGPSKIIIDRIFSGKPGSDCDAWFNHEAAMKAASSWVDGESTPMDHKGGHLLPRQPKYDKGDKVQVFYEEDWWDAKVLRRKEHGASFRYQVHYSADNSKQSGVDEANIRPRPPGETSGEDPNAAAEKLGFGPGWEAFSTGNNKWKIVSPDGTTYRSKKKALDAYAEELNGQPDSMMEGDPPWRTTDNEYLGRKIGWKTKHKVSGTRTVTVEQTGAVVGWISETDVDKAGEPGFVSERTGKPARLFHVKFDDDPRHVYASHLVQSQDLEEFELLESLLPEDESAKKRARTR